MPRENLDRHIHHVQDEILLLGSMVEQAMMDAIYALKQHDFIMANRIIKDDQLVNDKRYAIENAILILMATQQPVAHDLRLLASMLEIIIELERMGDYAKGVSNVTIKMGDADISIPITELMEMASKGVNMLHRALDAFIKEDPKMASIIFAEDDIVDDLYKQVESKVMKDIIAHPECSDVLTMLFFVAHNLERMADRVTNICERTIFTSTGEQIELEGSEDDDPE